MYGAAVVTDGAVAFDSVSCNQCRTSINAAHCVVCGSKHAAECVVPIDALLSASYGLNVGCADNDRHMRYYQLQVRTKHRLGLPRCSV